jgi:hypothetical protein
MLRSKGSSGRGEKGKGGREEELGEEEEDRIFRSIIFGRLLNADCLPPSSISRAKAALEAGQNIATFNQ